MMKNYRWLIAALILCGACGTSSRRSADPFGAKKTPAPAVAATGKTPAASNVAKINLDNPQADARAAFNRGDRRFYRLKDPQDRIWGVPSYTQAVGPIRVNGFGYEYATKAFDGEFADDEIFTAYRRYAIIYNDELMLMLEKNRAKNESDPTPIADLPTGVNPRGATPPADGNQRNTDYPEYMFPALSGETGR